MTIRLPKKLTSAAYFSRNGEAAWPRDDAIAVIDWASSAGIAVFGVEIWLPTIPGPTIPSPTVYTWESEQQKHESWDEFVERANRGARCYIAGFCWAQDDEAHQGKSPFFNLTLGRS